MLMSPVYVSPANASVSYQQALADGLRRTRSIDYNHNITTGMAPQIGHHGIIGEKYISAATSQAGSA